MGKFPQPSPVKLFPTQLSLPTHKGKISELIRKCILTIRNLDHGFFVHHHHVEAKGKKQTGMSSRGKDVMSVTEYLEV